MIVTFRKKHMDQVLTAVKGKVRPRRKANEIVLKGRHPRHEERQVTVKEGHLKFCQKQKGRVT